MNNPNQIEGIAEDFYNLIQRITLEGDLLESKEKEDYDQILRRYEKYKSVDLENYPTANNSTHGVDPQNQAEEEREVEEEKQIDQSVPFSEEEDLLCDINEDNGTNEENWDYDQTTTSGNLFEFKPIYEEKMNNIITISDDEEEEDDDDDDDDEILQRRSISIIDKELRVVEEKYGEEIKKVLREKFGHDSFRPIQKEAILSVIAGKNSVCIFPTGYGKSSIFQIATLVDKDKLSIVVEPLVSLMTDQVLGLKKKGVKCEYFSGEFSKTENDKTMKRIKEDKGVKFIYVTPEKIMRSGKFYSFLEDLARRRRISRFVIDEAHCISTWGFDFRKDYRGMNKLKNFNIPFVLLTGTATKEVENDIIMQMKKRSDEEWKVFKVDLNRSNLRYSVKKLNGSENKINMIMKFLKEKKLENSTGIIYCFSKKDTETVCSNLKSQGLNCSFYHSKVSSKNKKRIHKNWLNNKIKIITATTAFGMGVDNPNVRFVIHHSLPKSIFEYYQQSGRAGRDMKKSYCVLLFKLADVNRVKKIVDTQGEIDRLLKMKEYCVNTNNECRRKIILKHFGQKSIPDHCGNGCDICKNSSNRNENTRKRSSIIEKKDFTSHCKNFLRLINEVEEKRKSKQIGKTANHLKKIFRGSKSIDIKTYGDENLINYAKGNELSSLEVSMLIDKLKSLEYIIEIKKTNRRGFSYFYLKSTTRGNRFLMNNREKVFLQIEKKQKKSKKKRKKKKEKEKDSDDDDDEDDIKKKRYKFERNLTKVEIEKIKKNKPQTVRDLRKIGLSDENISKYGYNILLFIRKSNRQKISAQEKKIIDHDIKRISLTLEKVDIKKSVEVIDLTDDSPKLKKRKFK